MAAHVREMTSGKPAGLIFLFALPLMLGNVFQQMYTMVDTIIVGQVVGVEALAALGVCEWINWLFQGTITGFTQGFSILISHRFGAEDWSGLRKSVAMSTVLAIITAAVVTTVSLLSAKPILCLLNTQENVMNIALDYMHVLYGGTIAYTAYNTVAAILRAMGDSRTPLIAMIAASFVNIGLDLLFVLVFGWGVIGAAAATVIAQVCSAVVCFLALRRISVLQMEKNDWKFDGHMIKNLFTMGVPISFQNIIISIGGMVVQYVVNGFGILFVAGFTATNKLYGLLEVAATSFGFSMATYCGQNLGAKKYRRIQSGTRSAAIMAIATSMVISASMFLFGRNILMLFISGDPNEVQQVLDIAYTYLRYMSSMLFLLYLLYIYRSGLQGLGDTVTPMVSGIAELVMRIGAAMLLPLLIGQTGIYFAEILAWLGAVIILITVFYIRLHRLLKRTDGIA